MEFLRIQRRCLHLIGFSLKVDESRALQLYSLLNWTSMLGVTITMLHFVVKNRTDIPLASDALCTVFTFMLALIKTGALRFKKDAFNRVIDQLDDMWRKSSTSDRLILQEGHKTDKRLTLLYLYSSGVAITLYLTFPIAKAMYELRTTGVAEWIIPMRSEFVYDISVSPNYELTYLWFVHSGPVVLLGTVGVDCLIHGSSLNISSHFKIIQKKARAIKFDQLTAEHNARSANRVAKREFSDLIKQHQNTLHICEEFENMYSTIMFVQFLVTSTQMCLVAFQLTLPNQELVKVVTFGLYLSGACFQLLTYCHAGSQLTTESVAVSDAIYDSNWYEAKPMIQKLAAFFLMRSQKSVVMASGFYVADMETFNSLISAAFSYIAILQSMAEEDN